jgi:hypothetical protein
MTTLPAWREPPEIPKFALKFLNVALAEMKEEKEGTQMAKGKLFTYVVLHHPKQTRDAGGNDTTPPSIILIKPTDVLSSDPETVGKIATRQIPAAYDDKLETCEIIIRPFA